MATRTKGTSHILLLSAILMVRKGKRNSRGWERGTIGDHRHTSSLMCYSAARCLKTVDDFWKIQVRTHIGSSCNSCRLEIGRATEPQKKDSHTSSRDYSNYDAENVVSTDNSIFSMSKEKMGSNATGQTNCLPNQPQPSLPAPAPSGHRPINCPEKQWRPQLLMEGALTRI